MLCGARFFSALSVEDVCEVRGLIGKRHYGAREVLFRQGDPGTHLYVLNARDCSNSRCPIRTGREQIIGLTTPG